MSAQRRRDADFGDFFVADSMQQFATFWLAGELFGVDVNNVQEVMLAQAVTPVPLAPPYIVGLANLRGQIMPTFSLRVRFGMPPREDGKGGANLVVKTDEGPVSLVVDEIGDVIEIPSNGWRDVPETMNAAQRQFVTHIYPDDGRLILRLELGRVFDDDAKAGAGTS
jgi:purine-binding chemotaxis protein CheW